MDVKEQLNILIGGLQDCELNKRKCKKCKKKDECLLFMRSCIAVALTYIKNGIKENKPIPNIFI